jgi:hypothetical protein
MFKERRQEDIDDLLRRLVSHGTECKVVSTEVFTELWITHNKFRIILLVPSNYPIEPPKIHLFGRFLKKLENVDSKWINNKSNNGPMCDISEIWNPISDNLVKFYELWLKQT